MLAAPGTQQDEAFVEAVYKVRAVARTGTTAATLHTALGHVVSSGARVLRIPLRPLAVALVRAKPDAHFAPGLPGLDACRGALPVLGPAQHYQSFKRRAHGSSGLSKRAAMQEQEGESGTGGSTAWTPHGDIAPCMLRCSKQLLR